MRGETLKKVSQASLFVSDFHRCRLRTDEILFNRRGLPLLDVGPLGQHINTRNGMSFSFNIVHRTDHLFVKGICSGPF